MTKLEEFLDQFKSTYTRNMYSNFLHKVEEAVGPITKKNLKKVKEYIDNLKINKRTKQQRHFIVKSYLNFLGITPYKFDEVEILVEKKQLPSKDEVIEILKEKGPIKNPQDQLIMNLLFGEYPQVLRTDLANVKLKNYSNTEPHYKDGQIIFPEIRKTNFKNIRITLNNKDRELLESLVPNQEYLINFRSNTNRNNAYTKYIQRITNKYIGIKLSQTDIRHITSTHQVLQQDLLTDDFIEKYKLLSMQAKARGHSLETALKHYTHFN